MLKISNDNKQLSNVFFSHYHKINHESNSTNILLTYFAEDELKVKYSGTVKSGFLITTLNARLSTSLYADWKNFSIIIKDVLI